MGYAIEVILHEDLRDHTLIVKDDGRLLFNAILNGRTCYYKLFTHKNGDEWIVLGGSKSKGFNFYNLTKRQLIE